LWLPGAAPAIAGPAWGVLPLGPIHHAAAVPSSPAVNRIGTVQHRSQSIAARQHHLVTHHATYPPRAVFIYRDDVDLSAVLELYNGLTTDQKAYVLIAAASAISAATSALPHGSSLVETTVNGILVVKLGRLHRVSVKRSRAYVREAAAVLQTPTKISDLTSSLTSCLVLALPHTAPIAAISSATAGAIVTWSLGRAAHRHFASHHEPTSRELATAIGQGITGYLGIDDGSVKELTEDALTAGLTMFLDVGTSQSNTEVRMLQTAKTVEKEALTAAREDAVQAIREWRTGLATA
jgi:hypothetical protein